MNQRTTRLPMVVIALMLLAPVVLGAQSPAKPSEGSQSSGQTLWTIYEDVIRRIHDGEDPSEPRVTSSRLPRQEPALNWYLKVHVEPSLFGVDTLFTIRVMTNGDQELRVTVPRGGVSFWYQLTSGCMQKSPALVEDAASRLVFTRLRLTQKTFPELGQMVNEFKAMKPALYLSDPKVLLTDGISYSFRGKSSSWSIDIKTANPDRDNALAVWADKWAATIWEFIKRDQSSGLAAHPITLNDPICIGQVLLRNQSYTGELDEVQQFLRLGVPVDAPLDDPDGTALLAAVEGKQLETLRVLLSAGANPRAIRKRDGRNAIHLMVLDGRFPERQGHPDRFEVGKLLLERHVDLDLPDDDGITPLMLAIEENDPPLASWLVRRGANPVRQDKAGKSARDRAAASGKQPLMDALPPIK